MFELLTRRWVRLDGQVRVRDLPAADRLRLAAVHDDNGAGRCAAPGHGDRPYPCPVRRATLLP
jgi:hypothetical protein